MVTYLRTLSKLLEEDFQVWIRYLSHSSKNRQFQKWNSWVRIGILFICFISSPTSRIFWYRFVQSSLIAIWYTASFTDEKLTYEKQTRSCEASLQKHPLGTFRPENLYWRGPAISPCSSPLETFRQESLCWQNVPNSAGQGEGLFLQATVRPNNAKPSPTALGVKPQREVRKWVVQGEYQRVCRFWYICRASPRRLLRLRSFYSRLFV